MALNGHPGKHARPSQSVLSKALQHTLHPAGTSVLQQLLSSIPGDDIDVKCRTLVLRILDGPCSEMLGSSGPMANVPSVKANGRVNQNLHGVWVFTYDQRMKNSKWNKLTVLCRGLAVLFPRPSLLAEGFDESDLQPGARLDHDQNTLLRRLCTSSTVYRCCMLEPMPKFWEGGEGLSGELSWDDVLQACDGLEPRLMRVEEKVDGNLGMLYPQYDESLNPLFDAAPLLCTKGVGHSPDIERQTLMLHQHYPGMRLSPDISHAIVEVVDLEMKVVVPYQGCHIGARLIAGHSGERWLDHATVDEFASAWCMPRPLLRELPMDQTFQSVRQLALDYSPAPGKLVDEGFVLHLGCLPDVEVIRLKVHTHFWDVVHGWWEDNPKSKQRISVGSVLRVLRDARFANSIPAIEPCLVKYKGRDHHRDDALVFKFRTAVELARCSLRESLAVLSATIAETASLPLGSGLKSYLERQWPELSAGQRAALSACVMRLRSNSELGFTKQLDPELVARLPGILQQIFGELGAPEVEDENSRLVRWLRDNMHAPVFKVVGAWADAAQRCWDQGNAHATLDPPCSPEALLQQSCTTSCGPGDPVPQGTSLQPSTERLRQSGQAGLE